MSKRSSENEIKSADKRLKLATEMLDSIDADLFDDEFICEDNDSGQTRRSSNEMSDGENRIDDMEFDEIDVAVALAQNTRNEFVDLSSWQRCIVDTVSMEANGREVTVRGREFKAKDESTPPKPMLCTLQDNWIHTKICEGAIISIIACWHSAKNCFCISSQSGFIVVQPDLLISGTSLTGALFCMRKAILSDRFKGIDSKSKIMTIGSLVHELFQIVLQRRLTNISVIQSAADELLNDPQTAYVLYSNEMTNHEARVEIEKFVGKIHEFVVEYIGGQQKQNNNKKKEDFAGVIDSIQDIEENIWIPKLGLKGKVDVSVNVRRTKNRTEKATFMPLELKTGRASFSAEHTGQLIIYQMMMSDINTKLVNSGLLLYLREGVMREVKGSRNEQRDLIILRNELAYYLTKYDESIEKLKHFAEHKQSANEIDKRIQELSLQSELPKPINHHSACQNCSYNVLCSVFLNGNSNERNSLSENHPMQAISTEVTDHLKRVHIEYFCRWTALLTLEKLESSKSNQIKSLWMETPSSRHQKGRASIDLKLLPNVERESDNEFVHEFQAKVNDSTLSKFSVGQYVIVSTPKRLAVAAGLVRTITKQTISIRLERNLNERFPDSTFIVDKYESQKISSFNMENLGALLDRTEAADRLRKCVIERIPPTFVKHLPKIVATEGKPILRELNPNQRTAVLKALTVNEYLLLKGLPGTGKTQTLTAIIRLLVLMGKSVLVTSHTHSAVDNLLVRLLKSDDKLSVMRIGSASRVNPKLAKYCETELTANCKTPEDFAAVFNEAQVVGVTCMGSSHSFLTQKVFDVCLVDESTQVVQSTVLRPLFSAMKFILVGDPDQLPPMIQSTEARLLGADESLFAHLDSEQATVTLKIQYRMNKMITKLANALTYRGTLECANEKIANATICQRSNTNDKWLQKTLTPHIDQSVIFLDTGNVFDKCIAIKTANVDASSTTEKSKSNRIYENPCEAALVLKIIKELLACGMSGTSIGVITTYSLQVELLRRLIATIDSEVEVNTVDQYQGRDKEVIIYSCCRTGATIKNSIDEVEDRKKTEILSDHRRLTVAVTRAKCKLIIIGDANSLRNYKPFRQLLDNVNSMNKTCLRDGQLNFDWSQVLDEVQFKF